MALISKILVDQVNYSSQLGCRLFLSSFLHVRLLREERLYVAISGSYIICYAIILLFVWPAGIWEGKRLLKGEGVSFFVCRNSHTVMG